MATVEMEALTAMILEIADDIDARVSPHQSYTKTSREVEDIRDLFII